MLTNHLKSILKENIWAFIVLPDRSHHKGKIASFMDVVLPCLNSSVHPVYAIECLLMEALINKDEDTIKGIISFYWKLRNFLTRSSIDEVDMDKLLRGKYISSITPHWYQNNLLDGHINIRISNKLESISPSVWRDIFAGVRRNGKTVNLYASQSEWFNDLIESRHMEPVVKVLHYGATGFEVGFAFEDVKYPTINLLAYLMLDVLHGFMISSDREDVIHHKVCELLPVNTVEKLRSIVGNDDVETLEIIRAYSAPRYQSKHYEHPHVALQMHSVNMYMDLNHWYKDFQALK